MFYFLKKDLKKNDACSEILALFREFWSKIFQYFFISVLIDLFYH